jgi:magnesium transporter
MASKKTEASEIQDLLRVVRARVPVDAAELLAPLPPERIAALLKELPRHAAVRIASHLPENLRPADITQAAEDVVPDAVADLTEMTTGALPAETRVKDAIDWLRQSETARDLTYLYVVAPDQRLLGLVVMRDLLLADADETLRDVMLPNPFTLRMDQPLDDAIKAAVMRHYPVYPVCDAEGKFHGVVRGYRLFEQQAIEISAQSGQMVGVNKEERVDTTVWESFKMRHPWLQLNLLTAFLAGFVVSIFEDTISQVVALAAFLPILAGQSGNNGCQALAITLRGLTLGDTDHYPLRRLIGKEAMLGAMNGIFTGCIAGLAMWWSAGGLHGDPHALKLAGVIVIAMTGACMASGVFGVLIPLLLRRIGADPSTASAIFLTTGTDISSMGLMLFLATALVLN